MSEFNFSPSLMHRHLLDNTEHTLSYKSGDVHQWQGKLRTKLSELIGDMPSDKCPLNIRRLWM